MKQIDCSKSRSEEPENQKHQNESLLKIGDKEHATRVLFSQESIQGRVAELACEIEQRLPPGLDIVVLVVLDGAMIFAADLIRQMKRSILVETVKLKSYSGMSSTGNISLVQPVSPSLRGKHVLVVEDIVDTGKSLKRLCEELEKVGAASVHVACLLAKPECHIEKVQVDFIGYSVGKNFVIGYGLDADGRYRNLPYIAEVLL